MDDLLPKFYDKLVSASVCSINRLTGYTIVMKFLCEKIILDIEMHS